MLVPILLSAAHTLKEGETIPLSIVRGSYLKKCTKYQFLPLVVSPDMSEEAISELYRLAAGVLFLGGADIDPSLYGRERDLQTGLSESARDKLEIDLFNRAFSERKPFLGICRGAQLMAVASGGTLIQHLPDITTETHNSTYEGLKSGAKHEVQIEKGSRLYSLLKQERGFVNSAHHQCVENVPAPLTICARSSKSGIIEAIEAESHFCFGLQSHPEMEDDGFYEPAFAAFREAALAFRSLLQR